MKTLVMVLGLAVFAFPQQSASGLFAELVRQAEAGKVDAQVRLGLAYEEGSGAEQNDELALQWYRKAAEQGSARAQNNIGIMYSTGRGVAQDKSEAFRWYKKAALQGLAAADYNVAVSWFNGDGTSIDAARAYAWMMLAKRNGDPRAAQELSLMGQEARIRTNLSERILAELLEGGVEVPQDWRSAYDLYLKLANEAPEVALYAQRAVFVRLCQIQLEDKPGLAHDYAAAKSWCRKGEQRGDANGDMILGRMAEQGLGGPKDLKEAEHWFHEAAIKRSGEGMMEMGKLKLLSGSHSDEVEAYYWLYMAAALKIEGAEAMAAETARHLSKKEISKRQKKAENSLTFDQY